MKNYVGATVIAQDAISALMLMRRKPMSNRYLFRGKRIDSYNKEWTIGHYVSVPRPMIVLEELQQNGSWYWFDVDPATVGQTTGFLAAKSYRGDSEDARLVFEGDVIKCSCGCPHEVIWLQEYAGTYGGGMPAFYLSGLRDGYAWTGAEEIIGNRFDHPELLARKRGIEHESKNHR